MNKLIILLLSVCMAKHTVAQQQQTMYGKATFYSERFNHRRTSNGEIFNMDSFTAASKNLPFGSILKVTNLTNNKSVIVRVNDRCPGRHNRILDLSKAAAKSIDMMKQGVANVKIENLGPIENFIDISNIAANKQELKPVVADNTSTVKTAYAVQIGTFKVKSNVDKLTASLKVKGFKNNQVKKQDKNSETVYKVTIGPFISEEEANKALKKLKSQKFDGWIIKGDELASL